jgi:CRISPR-associated protein Cas1
MLPLDDIAVLMIESQQVALTTAVLSRLAEVGASVIACDSKHMPVFIGYPCASHSRLSGIHRMQLAATLPFRKRCWQRIVQMKIRNQAECLRLLGCKGADRLLDLASQVRSGDPNNVEGLAAREYFRSLFGDEFLRMREDGINAVLNYGYAVLRASIARSLAVHGFLLTQGVHHSSELNPFNLADDFLEPLRPLVDMLSATFSPMPVRLEKKHREALAGLLACDVCVDGQVVSVTHCCELIAASFLSACRKKDPSLIKLPELMPLREHRYE